MASEELRRIGETVTILREQFGLSQKELAAAVGTSQSMISRLQMGSQEIPMSRLAQVAELFGMTLGQLIDCDISKAGSLPKVTVARSVVCEEHGVVDAGLTADDAMRAQADHIRIHIAARES